MDLSNISIEQLEKELFNRQEKVKKDAIPKLLQNPDLSLLASQCQEFITDLAEDNRTKDVEYYIFETVMGTFFGNNIFQWLNNYEWGE